MKPREIKYKINYEDDLNPEQIGVVFSGKGHSLVLAGAGSGKTRTLTYRVAYLLENGVKPENILLVTFTNKAAREMLYRIEKLLGYKPKGLMGGTFHHVANILCRKYAKFLGYDNNFSILDTSDVSELLNTCRPKDFNIKERRFPKGNVLRTIYSLHVNCELDIDEIIDTRYPQFLDILDDIHATLKTYEKKKKKMNVMDFDDLLVNWLKLLYTDEIRKNLSNQFKYILVDEYQDVNNLQADIIIKLGEEHGNILVVGDDSQSIYSFRGANIENIFHFEKQLKDVKIYKITTNYRSTPEILNFANSSIINNEMQYFKELKSVKKSGEYPGLVTLTSSEEQAKFISQRILELRDENIKLNEIAILYRAHFHSTEIELELNRSNIPYIIRSGKKFFERAHIKDVLSYLKILENPKDQISWIRALKMIKGIGNKGADSIWQLIADSPNPLQNICRPTLTSKLKGKRVNQKAWIEFIKFLNEINRDEIKNNPSEVLSIAFNYYKDYLENSFENFEDRKDDIEQLILFSQKYKSLEEFIVELVLEQETIGQTDFGDNLDENEHVILSTIHGAKGLEWNVVFIISIVDGYFPSHRITTEKELEEERRLFYVAVTRAKKYLYLTVPIFQRIGFQSGAYGTNRNIIAKPSIFIEEIPPDYYEKWDVNENSYF